MHSMTPTTAPCKPLQHVETSKTESWLLSYNWAIVAWGRDLVGDPLIKKKYKQITEITMA